MLGSCKKYLDVTSNSTVSADATFGSLNNSQMALTGVYNELAGDYGYGIRLSIYYPQWGEDFKSATGGSGTNSDDDRRSMSAFNSTPVTKPLDQVFTQMYAGIERANICIKYIPKSALYAGNGSSATTMKKLYGEALTLRALFAMELIRNWGDIPFSFVPSEDVPDLYLKNMNRDDIYDHILDDLKTAATLVPWRTESGDPVTRINKAFIKTLRARIALARGGYSLRTDSRKMERRSDYKTFYQIAYDECKDLMTHREQNTINPAYEDVFRSLHPLYRGADDAYHEMIFAVGAGAAANTNAQTDSKLGYANGLVIDDGASYGRSSTLNVALPTYFYEFDSIADSRRDVTISSFKINNANKKLILTATTMTEGKFRRTWSTYTSSGAQYLDIRWPIARFADVLLMFAEADNELNGSPSGAAQSALKEVRTRAYATNLSRMPAVPTDYAGFFNAIVQERLLEFGGEGIRRYDLVRWNLLAAKVAETKAKLRSFADTSAANTGRYSKIPVNVYYTAVSNFSNGTIASEMSTLSLYGGSVSSVLFTPGSASTPTGTTKVAWRAALVPSTYLDDPNYGYAYYFKENLKELLPFSNVATSANFNLAQNPY